jgi:hypothetical protein
MKILDVAHLFVVSVSSISFLHVTDEEDSYLQQ